MSEQDSLHRANNFKLKEFQGSGYDKGKSFPILAAWFAVQHLVFVKWWCPTRFRVGILRVFGASIGNDVLIRHGVRVHWPWKLSIGDNTWLGEGAWILNLEPVSIGANSVLSQDAFVCTGSHDRRSPSFEFDNGPIDIGNHVWIAARSTLLRGIVIGDGATVGAGAVVSRDVASGQTIRT